MKVHSGESDFDPPRFKPNPSVYLKAAETEGKEPVNCIAVEDSGSGVGSASNAGVGESRFAGFGSVWLFSVRFGSVRFGSVRFGSVRVGSGRVGSVSSFNFPPVESRE